MANGLELFDLGAIGDLRMDAPSDGGNNMPAPWLLGLQAAGSVLGGGGQQTGQRSSGTSFSRTQQDVFLGESFERLFGGAESAASRVATQPITDTANRLFNRGTRFIEEFERVAGGGDDVSAPTTTDAQIEQLQSDIGRLFSEELNPEITSAAATVGGLGGSRQGVAQAGATRVAAEEFARGATDIRTRAIERDIGIAERNRAARQQAAQAGASLLPQQFDIAQAGATAPLAPFMALSDILGRPTTLTRTESRSQQESEPVEVDDGGLFGFL